MDSSELVERLRRAQVPAALYEVPGWHEVSMRPDAFYFLRAESGRWVVGLRERSRDTVIGSFDTEDEACRYLYERLTDLPAPVPGGAERVEEVLADSEEIQRQAWEDFERARKSSEAPEDSEDPPAQP